MPSHLLCHTLVTPSKPQARQLAEAALLSADSNRLREAVYTLLGRCNHALGDFQAAQQNYAQVRVYVCCVGHSLMHDCKCTLSLSCCVSLSYHTTHHVTLTSRDATPSHPSCPPLPPAHPTITQTHLQQCATNTHKHAQTTYISFTPHTHPSLPTNTPPTKQTPGHPPGPLPAPGPPRHCSGVPGCVW